MVGIPPRRDGKFGRLSGETGGVRRGVRGQESSRRAGSGRQAYQEGREDLGGPPRELGWVESISRRPVGVVRAGRGWDDRRRSGVPHVVLGMVGKSSRRAGRGHEALLGSLDGLRDLLAGPAVLGGFGRPTLMAEVWKPSQNG